MTKKITVIGDDRRFLYAAQRFQKAGLHVNGVAENLYDADYFLLPVPVTLDGVSVKGSTVKLTDFMDRIQAKQKIFCGMPPENLKNFCLALGVDCYDYMTCPELTHRNALLTAKGIIREARESHAVLEESNTLVLGYGHCGKALANALAWQGAKVDVLARRSAVREEAGEDDFGVLPMYSEMSGEEKTSLEKYSYVFNTIPALVLNGEFLSHLSQNVMIFDIASKPGGTDFTYCSEHGIYAALSLGIPGRHYPKEAGDIIADTVLARMNL